MIGIGDAVYICIFLDEAAPAGTFDHAASASHFWQTASDDLARHKAHIVLAQFQAGDKPPAPPVAAALVMQLAAVVCDLAPVIGVFWSNGETVTQPQQFVSEADRLTEGAWPAYVWVQYTGSRQTTAAILASPPMA